jgi:hypothetical protein
VGVAALPLSWWVLIINNGPGSPSRPCLAGNSSVGVYVLQLCPIADGSRIKKPENNREYRDRTNCKSMESGRGRKDWALLRYINSRCLINNKARFHRSSGCSGPIGK